MSQGAINKYVKDEFTRETINYPLVQKCCPTKFFFRP